MRLGGDRFGNQWGKKINESAEQHSYCCASAVALLLGYLISLAFLIMALKAAAYGATV